MLPLSVSSDAAAEIDHCVHQGYLNRYVRPAYEKAAGVSFDELPKQAQARHFLLLLPERLRWSVPRLAQTVGLSYVPELERSRA